MQRRMAVIDYLVSATSVLDVQKRSRYLVHIAQHDRSQMLSLAKAFKDLAAKKTELVRLKVEKESSLQEIEDITASLEKKRFAQGTLLGNLKTQKKQREMAVERYQASAKKLESLLSDLMGKRIVKRAPKPKTTPQVKETSSTEIVQPTPTLKPEVYPKGRKMHGLRGFRGRLPLPVQGTVIRKYGAQHHADFSDVFFVKGLEFSVQAGSEIKAVAYGRVIFAETVPEYGNVVIVNHGKRFYTLYGRLNEIVPLVGDIVEGGDVLARTGKKDRWGRNFYFELRYKGKAIDPWRYFANSPPYQPR
jgi:septal ring factor EnvC (AmiA/AmiB activator)